MQMGLALGMTRRGGGAGLPADVPTLITALGGDAVVPAFYDARTGVGLTGSLVDSWADARGGGFGPALTATTTARPTYDAVLKTLTFDGTANFLRASAGYPAFPDSCAVVLVCTIPPGATGPVVAELSPGATNLSVLIRMNATPQMFCQTPAAGSANVATTGLTGTRVCHGRQTIVGGNITSGMQIGSGTEVTVTAAAVSTNPTRLTIGASRADVAALWSAFVVRAVLVYKGDYAGKQATVNTWANANHGATL
jgi:hypothetical protein